MGIPDQDSFTGMDKAGRGLVELPLMERDGLIWVLPEPDGDLDLAKHLGELGPELASYGFGDYHHYETRVIRRKLNWKIVIDPILEPYPFRRPARRYGWPDLLSQSVPVRGLRPAFAGNPAPAQY